MSWFDCDYPCFSPAVTILEAVQNITRQNIPYDYFLITEQGKPSDRFLGMATCKQLLSLLADAKSGEGQTVASILDNSAIALNQLSALQSIVNQPEWCAVQLHSFMAEQRIDHLPILDKDGVAIAVITQANLAQRMAQHINKNECVSEKQEIATRENYLLTLSKLQSLLLEAGSYRHKLQDFVNLLGQSSNASRAYIFAYHRNDSGQILASQLVEWCADGITPQIDNPRLQNLAMETCFPNVLYEHCHGRSVCALVRELQGTEQELLAMRDIHSILILPIIVQGECWGALGFDDCLQERLWQEAEIAYLETAAKSLASTIQKEQVEVFYKTLFDHSTDAIFLVDSIDFTIIDANQRAVELFEAESVNDLIGIYGKSLHRYPESDAEFIANHQALVQDYMNKDYWCREIEYRTLKGNTFWGSVAGKKVTVLDVDYLLVRVSDISDRKRSEQILKEQKEFLESIYEGAGQSIFIIDVTPEQEFIIRDANPTFERLTSLKRNYIANKKPSEVLPPDIAKSSTDNYRRCITEGRTITYEEYAPIHAGASWWVTTLTPLYDGQDQPYRIIGTSIEISDRKKAEQALRDSELLLKETEAISKVGGWFIDMKTKRAECTEELQKILGLPKGLLKFSPLQNPQFYLSFFDEADQRILELSYSKLLKMGTPLDLELPLTAIDGKRKWVQLSAHPIRDAQTQEIIKISGSIIDITEKKQMELELQASENRFRTLMENLNVGVVLHDPSGKIQLFNSKALELLGLTADQLLGKTAFDPQWRTINPDGSILPPEEHPISLVLSNLQPVYNVVMGVHRQREDQEDVVWLLVNADPQFDQQRQLLDVVVCFTDISEEYMRTEEKLFSESRYRQIIQTQQEYVLVSLPDTRIIFANNSLCQALGMTLEEVKTKTWSDVVPLPDMEILLTKISGLSPQNPTFENTNINYLANGKIGWTQWLNQGFFDEMGNLIEIQSIGRDITELKLLDKELQKTASRYKSLIENSNDVIFILSREGNLLYVSPSSFHILGSIPPELEGRNVLELINSDDRQLVEDTLARAIAYPFQTLSPIEFQALTENKGWRWFEGTATNLLDDESVQGIVLNFRDISDRKRLQTELTNSLFYYQQLIDNVPAVVFRYTLKPDGSDLYEYLSENCIKMFTLPRQAIPEDNSLLWHMLHPSDRQKLQQAMQVSAKTGNPLFIDYRLISADGKWKWIQEKSQPSYRDNGEIVWDGVMLEITELKEQQELLSQVVESCLAIIYIYDIQEQRNIYINQEVYQVLGYTPAEIQQLGDRLLTELFHPEDWELISRNMELFNRDSVDRVYETTYRIRHKDGSYRWLLSRDRVFRRDEQGRTKQVIGIATDITQLKTTEIMLTESENRLNAFLDNIPGFVCIKDLEDRYLFANNYYSLTFGISPDEMIGKTSSDILPEPVAQLFRQNIQQVIKAQQTQVFEEDYWLNGKHYVNLSTKFPLFDVAGNIYGVGCVSIDISDRIKAETALRQSEQRLLQIFHNVPVAIYRVILDAEHRYWLDYVSHNFWELMGMEEQQLPVPMEQAISVIHPDDHQHVLDVVAYSTQTLSRCYKEFRVGRRWLSADGVPLMRSNGEIVWDGILQDITSRKELIDELDELNTHLELVVESSNVGLYLTDLITGKSYVSPAYKAQLGYPPDSPHGVPCEWRDRLHPEDKERSIQAFQAFLKQEVPNYNIDFRLRHRDGTYRWISSSAKLITNESGKPIKVVGSHVDITERKHLEDQLRQSEMRFRQVFACSTLGMIIISREHRIEAVNNALCAMLEYEPHELEGKEIWQIIHPDDLPSALLRYERYSSSQANQETGYSITKRLVRKDGVALWTNYSVVFVLDTNQQVESRIAVVEDMTAYREAQSLIETANEQLEQMVRERTDALESSQSLLRQQLEKNELLLMISDRIRSTTSLNDILRRTVQEVREVLDADRVIIYRFFDDKGQGGIVIAEAIADGVTSILRNTYPDEVFPVSCHAEFRYGKVAVTSDRDNHPTMSPCLQEFMASVNVAASITAGIVQPNYLWGTLIVHSQTPRQWQTWEVELVQQLCTPLGVAIKQSELYQQLENELEIRRRAEQELQITNAELIRANRLKDEFLANMSHELRTPLNSILGLTEGLLQQVYGSLNSKQMQYLQTIERSGKHLLELINDILDLAKIESGVTVLNLAEVDLYQLCESSLLLVRSQAIRKGIQLSAETAPNLASIVADERQLRQLLLNLLSNAIKFTNSGGSVLLQISQQGNMISLAVSDTGIGIAEADMPKLFKPFSQVDSNLTRRYSGTGLGLALVKRIAELHGGSVSVTSELGKGSCFTVLIPAHRAGLPSENRANVAEQQDDNSLPPTLEYGNPQILLVEDNADNIETLQDYLEAHGYQVMVVHNGQEAVSAVLEHNPDLVLMDAQMPEMDGFSATQRIRAMPQFADLPIIIFTALSMNSDQEKAMLAGATAYLSKPFSLRLLLKKIDQLLASMPQNTA